MVLWKHGLPWDLFPRLTEEEVEFNKEMQRLRGPVPSWEISPATETPTITAAASIHPPGPASRPLSVSVEAYTALAILKMPISLTPNGPGSSRTANASLDSGCADVLCMSLSIERDWMSDTQRNNDDDDDVSHYSMPVATGQMKYHRLGEHPIRRTFYQLGRNLRNVCAPISATLRKLFHSRKASQLSRTRTL